MQELRVLYEPLSEDFSVFYPQLQDLAGANGEGR
jgi:acyl carrier protein phosphodiesterase